MHVVDKSYSVICISKDLWGLGCQLVTKKLVLIDHLVPSKQKMKDIVQPFFLSAISELMLLMRE